MSKPTTMADTRGIGKQQAIEHADAIVHTLLNTIASINDMARLYRCNRQVILDIYSARTTYAQRMQAMQMKCKATRRRAA